MSLISKIRSKCQACLRRLLPVHLSTCFSSSLSLSVLTYKKRGLVLLGVLYVIESGVLK